MKDGQNDNGYRLVSVTTTNGSTYGDGTGAFTTDVLSVVACFERPHIKAKPLIKAVD